MTSTGASLAIAVVAALAASLAVALPYGLADGVVSFAILSAVGAVTVLAARAAAARGRRLASVRRQGALTGAVAVAGLLLVLGLFAALMYVSPHDALMSAVAGAYAGVLALLAGRIVGDSVLRDIDRLSAALHAVGEGERHPRLPVEGRDELAALGEEVRAMAARLEAGERARRELVAAVSHDLRTPITSLQLLAEAVDDDVVDPATRRDYLARLTTHVRALSALLDDLFELSRLEAGDIAWSLERVRLDELVQETVAAMRPHGEARAVDVLADVPGDLAPARANPEKLQRVLFNLIQNAIRHTPRDGSVVVRAAPAPPDGLEVEVSDTGEGIASVERARVFEPFFRGGDGAARTDGGAGLGLAISRAIVEAHGGRIWLEDGEGGTRVRFSLRAAPV